MALMRWDPVSELLALREQMDRLFEEAIPRETPVRRRGRGDWTPPVDIIQSEEDIVVRAELPGVDIEDVSVEVEGDVLRLQGERKLDKAVKPEAYQRVERPQGVFTRSFTLPQGVDHGKIRATLKNGVLEVTLPLPGERHPKTIDVKVE